MKVKGNTLRERVHRNGRGGFPAALFCLAAAVLCVACVSILFGRLGVPGVSILYVGLLGLFLWAFRCEKPGRRIRLFCYLASVCWLTGLRLQAGANLGGTSCASIMIASVGFGRAAAILSGRMLRNLRPAGISFRNEGGGVKWLSGVSAGYQRLSSGKRFAIQTALLFLCWLPVLLAFWPGNLAYDSFSQLSQILDGYSTHHPLLHSLLLNGCYLLGERLGSANLGIALYTILQMSVLAGAFSYLLLFLQRRRTPTALRAAVFLMSAFLPLVSVLSVSATKDVLFTAMLTVSFVCICDFCLEPELLHRPGKVLIFLLSSVLLCLLRNQGIYVLAAALILLSVTLPRPEKKRMVCFGAAEVLAFFLISGGLTAVTGASSGSGNEMLSIPYQQIARVYVLEGEELPQDMQTAIEEILPDASNYDPSIADPVKKTAAGLEHPAEFILLYLELMKRYPFRYLEAVLYNDFGYWYIDDVTFIDIKDGYLEFNTTGLYAVEQVTMFPALRNLITDLFRGNDCSFQKIPVLSVLLQPAIYLWICLGLLIGLLRRDTLRVTAAPAGMVVVFAATLFAGPCVLPRYVLPLIPLLPALYVVLAQAGKGICR